jgi:dinuclear metal center YbgI/SA1388 family protein
MKVKDITTSLEQWAPLSLQENYDNSGLLVGDPHQPIHQVLITLDVTEAVIDEAIDKGCQLIIAHHPLIFKGLKHINTDHWVERCVRKAIKNDISIYAIHTNLDNVRTGVNARIAAQLGLVNTSILSAKSDNLLKLVTFTPIDHTDKVLQALYAAGAGAIGAYEHCSFSLVGTGSFRPSVDAKPFIGEIGKEERVQETRIEVILQKQRANGVLNALKTNHPYEEVAYYLSELINDNQETGSGMCGDLPEPMSPDDFIAYLKKRMQLQVVKHTPFITDSIQKIALCGGAGGFLLTHAIRERADVFISADFKYHDYFEADGKIAIADIGHYESEVFTKDLLYDFLEQKFANIAFRLSGVVTNPIIYS